jgi:CubicO group peptidase (beta-lactamase class C family)
MMISSKGVPATHGGLSARLRDIARFGQIFTDDRLGVVGNDHLNDLSSKNGIEFDAEQLREMQAIFGKDTPTHAAWQWDKIWADGMMCKLGYSGQGIFIAPKKSIVIAFFGTSDTNGNENHLLRISRQLATSGLLD